MITQARDYQKKAIDDIKQAFKDGLKKIILVSPTGTGKTFIFSMLAFLTMNNKKRVMVVTDRRELLRQAHGSLHKFGLIGQIINADTRKILYSTNLYVCSIQTLKSRKNKPEYIELIKSIDLLIIDECHKQDFNELVDDFQKFVLGVTATPRRSGKMMQLGELYEKIISTITVGQAIEREYLVNCEMYNVGGMSADGIDFDKSKGDYNEKQQFNKFNDSKLYKGLIANYDRCIPNTKSIVFCCNVEHAILTTKELCDAGYRAKYIVSDVARPKPPVNMSDPAARTVYDEKYRGYQLYINTFAKYSGDRDKLIEDFDNDKFDFFVNAGILATGYDCPSIESVIIYRLTSSISLWLQMIGRGSRLFPNKTHFNVMYFGDNFSDLGAYDAPRHWSLWHEESAGGGVAPVKVCGQDANGRNVRPDMTGCGRLIHAGWMICKKCGFKYPEKVSKEAEMRLLVYDSSKNKAVASKPIAEMTIAELEKHREIKKFPMPWMWHKIYGNFGRDALVEYCRSKHYNDSTLKLALNICTR